MNRKDAVNLMAAKGNITKAQADEALGALLDGIIETLSANKKVTFIGFGTFMVKEQKARKGFNPNTKKPMTIPASKKAKFKAGSKLQEALD
ncbi:MAG: HU family DNA-binding protein [Candidatus Coatesbacteria bacterium]|nr:HU family DNA-binding protein [Candidatus Coatesbacteria bacterium]